jgi:anaerobic dimethyl sulfoxide reductase subunit B (iron-sulfur subunit)
MAKQLGFYFDAGRCVECHGCEVACRSLHNVGAGIRWRRVWGRWYGEYPQPVNVYLSASCHHCEAPSCLNACPVRAIVKRAEDGAVIVNREECIGCQACADACPYGVPQFGVDGRMEKCYLCVDRLAKGLEPACVATCPGEALKVGELSALIEQGAEKHGQRLTGATRPSLVIVPASNPAGIKVDFHDFFSGNKKTLFHEE